MKLKMQIFSSFYSFYRYTFYKTWVKKHVMIVREEKSHDEWSVRNCISVPEDMFGLLKSKSVPPNIVSSFRTVCLGKENFHVRKNVDCFDLPLSVRKFLFGFDFENIPLSENQLGYMSLLEMLERYWSMVSNPQFPRLKKVKPQSPFSSLP